MTVPHTSIDDLLFKEDLFPEIVHAVAPVHLVAERIDRLAAYLSQEETAELDRKVSRKRAVEFIGGRLLAKICIATCLHGTAGGPDIGEESCRSMSILSRRDGKPILRVLQAETILQEAPGAGRIRLKGDRDREQLAEAVSGIFFSISHSRRFIFCAAAGQPVGVDVETVGARFEKIRGFIIQPRNEGAVRRYMEKSGEDERIVAGRIWAALECLVKLGTANLWAALDLATVTLIDGHTVSLSYPISPGESKITACQVLREEHVFSCAFGADMP